jgi:outer membrane protein assembly factor BamB
VDLPADYNPDVDYGFAWSPLVSGDLLLLGTGGRGLALRTKDGSFAWGNDRKKGACASPVPYVHDGKPAVALMTINGEDRESLTLYGVDPATGNELWRFGPWAEKWGAACVDPIVFEGRAFITSAEQHRQCALVDFRAGGAAKLVWSNNSLTSYTGGCVLLDSHLYGVDTKKRGRLVCLDWETGKERWSHPGFGEHATLVAAGDALLVQTSDAGELVVVRAKPEKYDELRRARVFPEGTKTFTAPVVANGRVYCRSYEGAVVCLRTGE